MTNDIVSTVIAVLAVGAFFALPAAVACTRTQTARSDDGVTIPQQRDEQGGDSE